LPFARGSSLGLVRCAALRTRGEPSVVNSDRSLSGNVETEQALLGSMSLDIAVLREVIPRLTAEEFDRDAHRYVYRTICDIYGRGALIDEARLAHSPARVYEYQSAGAIRLIADLEIRSAGFSRIIVHLILICGGATVTDRRRAASGRAPSK
jgi:DnaB-like helicase N terminal domain